MFKVSKVLTKLAMKQRHCVSKGLFSQKFQLRFDFEEPEIRVSDEECQTFEYSDKSKQSQHHGKFVSYVEKFININYEKLYGEPEQIDMKLKNMFRLIHTLADLINNKMKQKQKIDFFRYVESVNSKITSNIKKDKAIDMYYTKLINKRILAILKGSKDEYKLGSILSEIDFKDKAFLILLKYFVFMKFDSSDIKKLCYSSDYISYFEVSEENIMNLKFGVDNEEDADEEMGLTENTGDVIDEDEMDNLLCDSKEKRIVIDDIDRNSKLKFMMNQDVTHDISKINIENYQDYFEVTIIRQKPVPEESNWIYLMNLPQDMNENKFKNTIRTKLKHIGNVKNIIIHTNKEQVNKKKQVLLFEGVRNDTLERFIQDNFANIKGRKPSQKNEKTSLDFDINKVMMEKHSPLKKLAKFDNERMACMTSYALVEMETYEQKQKLLTPDMRVFGLYFEERCTRIEDADHKLLMKISNIPYGFKTRGVMEKINKCFKENDIPELKTPEHIANKIIINGSLVIGFQKFSHALLALEHLNKIQINGIYIDASFMFGNLRITPKGPVESLIYQNKHLVAQKLEELNNREMFNIADKKAIEQENDDKKDFLYDMVVSFADTLHTNQQMDMGVLPNPDDIRTNISIFN